VIQIDLSEKKLEYQFVESRKHSSGCNTVDHSPFEGSSEEEAG